MRSEFFGWMMGPSSPRRNRENCTFSPNSAWISAREWSSSRSMRTVRLMMGEGASVSFFP